MLFYDIDKRVEAFSTLISDGLDFEVRLPEHQAHGTRCCIVTADTDPAELVGVDALITQVPGLRIGVKTADCVPILVYCPASGSVAAIHSGWKGTLASITEETIGHMAECLGAVPAQMKAVIGPCIHLEAFEVGDELYAAFSDAGYSDFCHRMPRFGTSDHEQWHIDLPAIVRHQLLRTGVQTIELRPECTFTLHHLFYSARRLGPGFDRQRIINSIQICK